MNENLKGKRLLVLGCSNNAPDVEAYGKENGVKIVVAGLNFSEEIKAITDERYLCDLLDREALAKLIKEKNIDGVFCGGNENIISATIDVCEKLGLPFYSSRELWDKLMNKRLFKRACRAHGVPTMQDFPIDENDLEGSAASLPYPVVIKPVDNCGATGVMKCEKKEDFKDLYLFAKKFSRRGEVTVEEYTEGFEICAYYTFVDGNVTLSSMCDKYVRGNTESFIPLSEIFAYPSQCLQLYKEKIDKNMREMLLDLGIKNGITSMQGFYTDGVFRFFEMGYRLGGTAQYRYTSAVNGINSLHMMMTHALTGKMPPEDQKKDDAAFRKPCCTLTLLSKGGKVARIEGVEEARKIPQVLYIENRYKVGDTVPVTRTTTQFHVRCYIMADDVQQMKDLINHLQDSIQAYDENGEPMLITHFDTDKLTFGDNVFQ